MSDILALDSQGNVFAFDPSKVKHWDAVPGYSSKPGDYNTLYLVQGQWYLHIGDIFTELTPKTRPNYARLLTEKEARDWFLAVKVPMPEELAALRPAAFPSALRQEQESLITLNQAAALVHRHKRTLEGYKGRGMPKPRVRGGGGKPDLWSYAQMRTWLTKTFGILLPERFVADRNSERN
jgi:hypothetical protein